VKVEISRSNSAVDLLGWIDEIDTAVKGARVSSPGFAYLAEAEFRGRTFRTGGTTPERAREALRAELGREFIIPHASVNVSGLPDGVVARTIEGTMFDKLFGALTEKDQETGQQKIRDATRKAVTTFWWAASSTR
jgi:hypothetical protein